MARVADERLEPRGLGAIRAPPAKTREVGGSGAVERAEPQDALRPEPFGAPARLRDQPLQLVPVVASRRDECV